MPEATGVSGSYQVRKWNHAEANQQLLSKSQKKDLRRKNEEWFKLESIHTLRTHSHRDHDKFEPKSCPYFRFPLYIALSINLFVLLYLL
jgi:hypothetical protein